MPPQDYRKLKVLYIAGWQRSGSTVLANLLGQIDGFFSTGELYYLWGYVWFEDNRCGCGRPVRRCPLWKEVFDRAFGGDRAIDADEMRELGWRAVKTKHMPLLMTTWTRDRLLAPSARYLRHTERLYQAVAETTGSRVIVDSSKWPSYAYLLSRMPSLEVYVVHLVRDPRAVASSWGHKTLLPDRRRVTYMQRGSVDSSLRWLEWNLTAEVLLRPRAGRYLRVRYEDFVAQPRSTVDRILHLVGEVAPDLPFVSEHDIQLGVTHTVSGNPNRFRTGLIHLRPDDRWVTRMPARERALVAALTLPLLVKYRYPALLPQPRCATEQISGDAP